MRLYSEWLGRAIVPGVSGDFDITRNGTRAIFAPERPVVEIFPVSQPYIECVR